MIRRYFLSAVAMIAAVCVKAEMPQVTMEAAFRGDPVAQCDLALQYYASGDYDNAFSWFSKSAETENPKALYYLGVCYAEGRGVEKDLVEAALCYSSAAEEDLPEAQYMLAGCYQNGVGLQKNAELAYFWYKTAAENGHPLARYEYATLYCERDSREYCEHLKKAIADGVKKAYFPYGVYWLERSDYDDIEGLRYIRKAVAAGNPCAMTYMGNLYRQGRYVAENHEKAFKLFSRAADGGCIAGRYAQAECYEYGIGTSVDTAKALELYKSIADKYTDAKTKVEELMKEKDDKTVVSATYVTRTTRTIVTGWQRIY